MEDEDKALAEKTLKSLVASEVEQTLARAVLELSDTSGLDVDLSQLRPDPISGYVNGPDPISGYVNVERLAARRLIRRVKAAEQERDALREALENVDVALNGEDGSCTVCGKDDNKHCSACTARMWLRAALAGEKSDE